jgi:LysM repeat protein
MNPNLLVPGQVLNIPGPGGTVPSPAPGTTSTPGSQPGSGPTTYTVQRGDWFYAIARKFGVTVEALEAANPGVNPNFVFSGQVLNIPGSGTTPPPAGATNTPTTGGATPTPGATGTPGAKPSRYTVQPGDSLSSIAVRFNTTIYALQIVNHLAGPQFVYPGQVLIIPK